MYKSIGIIPAAGQAKRFGGIVKELLPVKDGLSLLHHAYIRLQKVCDLVICVTNKDKVHIHMKELKDVLFIEQNNNIDILGAIQSGMRIQAERYYFTMPDTYIRDDVFTNTPLYGGLSIGLFETLKPERFGCLQDSIIYDKNKDIHLPSQAWGVLSWKNQHRDLFLDGINLPCVLNSIINNSGLETWNIGEYYDMATIQDYIEYLKND